VGAPVPRGEIGSFPFVALLIVFGAPFLTVFVPNVGLAEPFQRGVDLSILPTLFEKFLNCRNEAEAYPSGNYNTDWYPHDDATNGNNDAVWKGPGLMPRA
jgi:hypothetical protein